VRFPATASVVILTAAVAAAPWLTTPLAIPTSYGVAAILYVAVTLWLVSLAIEKRRPHTPLVLCALVGIVLAYGSLLTLNGHPAPPLGVRRLSSGHVVSWLPGAVDRGVAFDAMVPLSAVLLAGLAMIDHARLPSVRVALLRALAGTGALLSVAASVDRVTAWDWPFPGPPRSEGGTRFAAFGYHGNAAAFLELALPAALLLAVTTATTRTKGWRALDAIVAALVVAGVATNVSKIGQLLGVAILVSFVVLARANRGPTRVSRVLAAVAVPLGLVVIAFGAYAARDRWSELPDGVGADSGRALMWEASAHTWQRTPVFGTGPGGFKLALPVVATEETPALFEHWIVVRYLDGEPVLIWMYAHDDPLQTLVEWGPIVGAILASIVLWPLVSAARAMRRPVGRTLERGMSVVALGAVAVHALVDFPLQIVAIQLAVTAWAAIALAPTGDRSPAPATLHRPRTATP
jgi:hypothetical protein